MTRVRFGWLFVLAGTAIVYAGQAPPPRPGQPPDRRERPGGQRPRYSIEQATSDEAQLRTIAFDGLAFLTGDFAHDTFLPPGKVSDFFGFQYMRDIDVAEGGHNTSFLTRIAHNMLTVLHESQREQLMALAARQEADIRLYAERRLVLIKAFRRNLEAGAPAGQRLDRQAVMRYSADLYALDGSLALQRAQVGAGILRSLDDAQRTALRRLAFGDSRTWPDVPLPYDRRRLTHTQDVAVMTYASELFSWYAGSLEADTYFCPERHGMYFGGFGLKTAPAMGRSNFSISTTLTADSGQAFLEALTSEQRTHVTAVVDHQRPLLGEVVQVRRDMAAALRGLLDGRPVDEPTLAAQARRYGELDGALSYLYATAFASVKRTLTQEQQLQLSAMRQVDPNEPRGPFLYSEPAPNLTVPDTGFLFTSR